MTFELIYLVFVAAGALALGNVARRPLHKSESKLEKFLVSSGLGFIILSLLVFFLGILGLYTKPVFSALNVLLLLLIAAQAKELARIALPDLSMVKDSTPIIRLVFAVFVAFAALNLVVSTAPPTSSDALLHHLTVPKIYLEGHRIVSIPSLQLVSEAPMSVNMLYLYGLELLNGKLSQAIAWYIGFLASLAVLHIATRLISKQAGIIAAALFATLPIFSVFNARPYVDIPLTFFALMATNSFLELVQKIEARNAVLTGLFLGMAISAKNIGILTGAALTITALLVLMKMPSPSRTKFLAQTIIVGLIAAALLSPWLVKSYINSGDPMYPLLYNYFGGTYWNNELSSILLEFHRGQGTGFSLQSLILFPFKLTVSPYLFADTAGITPMFLGTLPLLWLLRKRIPKQITTLLTLAAVLIALQFFTAQQTRYMFLAFGIVSIITAYIVYSFRTERLVQMGLYAFLVLSLAINAAFWAAANLDDLPVAVGLQSEHDYLTKKVPTYAATEFLASIDENAVVCWYGDGRGFWSRNPYIWCNPLDQGYVNFFEMKTSADVAARMDEMNVSYVLYEKKMRDLLLYGKKIFSGKTMEYYSRSNRLMWSYLGSFGAKVYEDNNSEIYKVTG